MAASNRYGQVELIQAIATHFSVIVYHVCHMKSVETLMESYRGELEVVVVTKELNAHFPILDDKMVRQFASTLMVSTIGTVGVLRLAKQCHLISEVKSRFHLIRCNFLLSTSFYTSVLQQVGESL